MKVRAAPRFTSIDFETERFSIGNMAPHPVCMGVCELNATPTLLPTSEIRARLRELLRARGIVLVGVNIAYDMACALRAWPALGDLIWEKYERGEIVDVAAWDRVAQIEQRTRMKRPSMTGLCEYYGVPCPNKKGTEDGEDEETRTSYGPLLNQPLSAYSVEQLTYATWDPWAGVEVAGRLWAKFPSMLADAQWLTRKQFWLQLTRNRGLRTDSVAVARLRKRALVELERLRGIAQEPVLLPGERLPTATRYGILTDPRTFRRVRVEWPKRGNPERVIDLFRCVKHTAKGNRLRLRTWVRHAYDGNPPMTKEPKKHGPKWKPSISSGKEVLEASGDAYLESIAEYGEWSAVVNKDLNMLSDAILHTRFWIAETTRSTSSRPNLQNFRRAAGIRECIIPRPGMCLVAGDHTGVELVAAAQNAYTLLGRSDMRDKLNRREDLHVHVGVDLANQSLGGRLDYAGLKRKVDAELAWMLEPGTARVIELPLDLVPKEGRWARLFQAYGGFRQFGKVPNFGCLGGMTYPPSLRIYARRQGIHLTDAQAAFVIQAWRRRNPDGQALLNYIRTLPESGYGFDVRIPGTGITRRGAPYCAAANTLFQGLTAKLEAEVGWALARACYDSDSPLSENCHLVNFVHDEFVFEVPIGYQTIAAREISRIMVDAAKPYVPDVHIGCEITAMARLSKKAKPIWENGELQIWDVAA